MESKTGTLNSKTEKRGNWCLTNKRNIGPRSINKRITTRMPRPKTQTTKKRLSSSFRLSILDQLLWNALWQAIQARIHHTSLSSSSKTRSRDWSVRFGYIQLSMILKQPLSLFRSMLGRAQSRFRSFRALDSWSPESGSKSASCGPRTTQLKNCPRRVSSLRLCQCRLGISTSSATKCWERTRSSFQAKRLPPCSTSQPVEFYSRCTVLAPASLTSSSSALVPSSCWPCSTIWSALAKRRNFI